MHRLQSSKHDLLGDTRLCIAYKSRNLTQKLGVERLCTACREPLQAV